MEQKFVQNVEENFHFLDIKVILKFVKQKNKKNLIKELPGILD